MSNTLDDLLAAHPTIRDAITSDTTTTKLAGNVEAAGRGILPTGAFSAIEKLSGATKEQLDTREKQDATTNGLLQFGGAMVRDTAAMALGGPAAAYGVAALNTLGDTANLAVDHSTDLTVEHVAGTLAHEMLGAWVGNVLPATASRILGRFNVAGRELAGRAATFVEKQVSKLGESKVIAGLSEEVQKALDNSVFSKARKHAVKYAQTGIDEATHALDSMLAPFNAAAAIPGESAAAEKILSTAKPDIIERFNRTYDKKLNVFSAGEMTPSDALNLEAFVSSIAKEAPAEEKAGIYHLIEKLGPQTDALLAERKLQPEIVRAFQQKIAANQSLLKSIPSDVLPIAGKFVAGTVKEHAVRGAVTAAGSAAAAVLGVPAHYIIPAVLMRLGGSGAGKVAASELTQTAKMYAGQKAYQLGQTMSQFERSVFSQHLANTLGEKGSALVKAAMQGGAQASVAAAFDAAHMNNLQAIADNPEAALHHIVRAVDGAPISDEQKQQTVAYVGHMFNMLKEGLPVQNPLSPPGARNMPPGKQLQFARKIQAMTDPQAVIRNPTREGLQALQQLRPATYSLVMRAAMSHAGPNVAPSAHSRVYMDALGLDSSLKQAGKQAQKLYAPPPPNALSQRRRPGHTNATNVNFHVNNAATAIDNVEKEEP